MSARHDLLNLHLPLEERQVLELDPRDDLFAHAVLVDAEGNTTIVAAPQLYGSDVERTAVLGAVADLCRKGRSVAAFVSNYAWFLDGAEAEAALAAGQRPRNHPKRQEVLVVIAVDAHGVTYKKAPVVRSAEMQMLGEWETRDTDNGNIEFNSEAINLLSKAMAV